MKSRLGILWLLVCLFSSVNAQQTEKNPFVLEANQLASKNKILEHKSKDTPATEKPKVNKEISKQTNPYVRPSKEKRFKRYVNNTIGPIRIGTNAAKATLFTITNNPEEWEKTGEGFARRFASEMGETAIKQTTIYGLDEALKVDSRFYKSPKNDIGSKFKNALISTFTARNKIGKRVVGVPRIVGTYATKIISREAWYPDRFNYKDGLRSGTISLGFDVVVNFFRDVFSK